MKQCKAKKLQIEKKPKFWFLQIKSSHKTKWICIMYLQKPNLLGKIGALFSILIEIKKIISIKNLEFNDLKKSVCDFLWTKVISVN